MLDYNAIFKFQDDLLEQQFIFELGYLFKERYINDVLLDLVPTGIRTEIFFTESITDKKKEKIFEYIKNKYDMEITFVKDRLCFVVETKTAQGSLATLAKSRRKYFSIATRVKFYCSEKFSIDLN